MIGKAELEKMLLAMAEDIHEGKAELSRLDSNGNHGTNMDRGFQAVVRKMPELMQKDDLGEILHDVGMILIGSVGGSSGPLFGTMFLRAGMVCKGHDTIDAQTFALSCQAAELGVAEVGMSAEGDKTLLDALCPAHRALQQSLTEGKSLAEALAAAVEAAEKGVEYTKTIVANKGRASYLGERSLGHPDPGAVSMLLMLKATLRAWS